jgi:hypothetical protein
MSLGAPQLSNIPPRRGGLTNDLSHKKIQLGFANFKFQIEKVGKFKFMLWIITLSFMKIMTHAAT